MTGGLPRFCPFCRECFEAEFCPEHDIPLVPFERLPRTKDHGLDVDERIALHDPRFGRGWVFAGALLLLVGFALPFVRVDEGSTASAFRMAVSVAPNLYTLPAVAFALFSILGRRRTPRSMRGARLVIPALAILGATSIAYSLVQVQRGVEHRARFGGADTMVPEVGVLVLLAALVAVVWGGLRFGLAPEG